MFSESCPPLPWDKEKAYSRDAVELYYEVSGGPSCFLFLFYSSYCLLPLVSDIYYQKKVWSIELSFKCQCYCPFQNIFAI